MLSEGAITDFSTEEAARLCRLSLERISEWDKSGFLQASVRAKRRGVSRRYTFQDLVALRVVAELRDEGVSLQRLRKVVEYLRAREGLSATEALARTQLVASGDLVYEVADGRTLEVPSGQRTMIHVTIPLHTVVADVQRRARALRRAA